jgi:hypothetical protein
MAGVLEVVAAAERDAPPGIVMPQPASGCCCCCCGCGCLPPPGLLQVVEPTGQVVDRQFKPVAASAGERGPQLQMLSSATMFAVDLHVTRCAHAHAGGLPSSLHMQTKPRLL